MTAITKSPYQFLNFSKFQKLNFWDYYTLSNKANIFSNFPLVELGTVLKQRKESFVIDDTKTYKRCRVQLYGNGVVLRDEVLGKEIKTKKQQPCKANDFLVAEIDAKFGGYGIVPCELENAIVSSHYFLFEINTKKLLPEFLGLVIKCNDFSKQVKATGSTNYAAIRPYHVLNYLIPLPSLEEQNQIVAAYNKRIAEAERLEKEAKQLEEGIEKFVFQELGISKKEEKVTTKSLNFINYLGLSAWGADRLLKGRNKKLLESDKYKNELLSSVTFINPKNDLNYLNSDSKMSFIPMECISDDYGEVTELRNGIRSNSNGYTKFIEGDLLWARITPCMQNGKSAIVKGLVNGAGYGSTEYHVIRQKQSNVIIEYIYHLLRLKPVLEEAVNFFTGSAGQQRVPKYYLENLVIPIPPIDVQHRIDSQIKLLKEDIKNKRNQAKTQRQQAITEFESKIFMPCN